MKGSQDTNSDTNSDTNHGTLSPGGFDSDLALTQALHNPAVWQTAAKQASNYFGAHRQAESLALSKAP